MANTMTGQDELFGRSVGEFVLRERIGEGGFGAVYRCEQPLLDRQAVVKVLHSRLRASEVMIQRFLREARLASRLDHPYAAHVYAFGVEKDDGLLWIAMEMVDGTTLDRWLRDRGPLPLADLVPFFERIAEVVQTAHDRGIVHRDLKPSNVMVIERAGRLLPKLLDLGIAKLQIDESPVLRPARSRPAPDALGDADTIGAKPVQSELATLTAEHDAGVGIPLDAGLTDAGATMGSPPYMAPEQWNDEPVGPKADLYALGVLAYEALTGRRPFTAITLAGFAEAHTISPVPPLGPGFSPALDRFFEHALAKRAEDRPATALALAAALRLASGLGDVVEVPKLDRELHDAWLARAPQPLAETVAALDGSRNLHQARDTARELLRGLVRYLLVLALAARIHVRDDDVDPELDALLRALRRRDLDDRERVRLLRRLVRPFSARRAAYPLPELVDFVTPRDNGNDALDAILDLDANSDPRGIADDLLHAQLQRFIDELARVLWASAFVHDYPLIVVRGGQPENWMGLRRARRAIASIQGRTLVEEQPALGDRDGRVTLLLWPLVQPLVPAPGAETELFVFDGRGRNGARLVAAPTGFERHDASVWEWFGEHVLRSEDRDVETVAEAAAPYLGLATFASSDATRFVGRERETDAFLNRLRAGGFLVVVGASGAGKSSFINAGVIPALPRGWRVIAMRPGSSPMSTLQAKLRAAAIPSGDARSLLDASSGDDGAVVIVVDQLEELVTLCLDETERLQFASLLADLSANPEGPVRVICTVRDDFLMRVESLPPLRRRFAAAVFLLGNPSREDLVRTIVEPARQVGYELSDPELAEDMAASVEGRPGALALLSFTASRLWELRDRRFRQLTRKAYDAMGGVGGALGHHAEATLTALTADDQRLVREAFRRLVTADGTRAQLPLAELDQVLASDRASSVIDKLIASRLLVTTDAEDGPRIEVAHEALLAAWPRAQQWIREDTEGARMRQQLRAAAQQWDGRGRTRALLWRGDVLAELVRWRARDPQPLSDVERAFADASRSASLRARRIGWLAAVALFATLATALVVLLRFNAEASSQRARAEASATEARAEAADRKRRFAEQAQEQGREALVSGKPGLALVHLLSAIDQDAPRTVGLDFMIGEAMRPLEAQRAVMRGHRGVVTSLAVVDRTRIVTSGEDGTLRIWDLDRGREIARMDAPVALDGVRVNPARDRIIAAGRDGGVRVFDFEGHLLHERRSSGDGLKTYFHPALSPDGQLVATVHGDERVVRVWNMASGQLARQFAVGGIDPRFHGRLAAWSPRGDRIAVAGPAELHDARTGALVARLAHDAENITALAFSDDGAVVVTSSTDRTARIWDARTGALRARLEGHDGYVEGLALDAGRKYVVTASRDRTARIWDRATGRQLSVLSDHGAAVKVAAFDESRSVIYTGGEDGSIRAWEVPGGRHLGILEGHAAAITALAVVDDHVLSASADGTIRRWRFDGAHVIPARCKEPATIDLLPDASRLAIGCRDGNARVTTPEGTAVFEIPTQASPNAVVHFVGGGRLLTRSEAGAVRLWSEGRDETPAELAQLSSTSLAVARDGVRFAVGTKDGRVLLWTVGSHATSHSHAWQLPAAVNAMVFSHGGDRLGCVVGEALEVFDLAGRRLTRIAGVKVTFDMTAAGDVITGAEDRLRLWDATGKPRGRELVGHVGAIFNAHYDFEDARVATAGKDGSVRIWNATTGAPLATLEGHLGRSLDARFDRRGLVMSIGVDSTLRVWDPASKRLLGVYKSHRGTVYQLIENAGFVVTNDSDGAIVIHRFPHAVNLDQARRLARCLPPSLTLGRIEPAPATSCP